MEDREDPRTIGQELRYKKTGRLLGSKKMSPMLIHVASFIQREYWLLSTSKKRRKAGGDFQD